MTYVVNPVCMVYAKPAEPIVTNMSAENLQPVDLVPVDAVPQPDDPVPAEECDRVN
jgi:hypothetical protein